MNLNQGTIGELIVNHKAESELRYHWEVDCKPQGQLQYPNLYLSCSCPYEDLEVNLEVVICGNVIEFDIDLP